MRNVTKRVNIDLSKIDDSATSLLEARIHEFEEVTTARECVALVNDIFNEGNLNTPWTKKFIAALSKKRSYAEALAYIWNTYLNGTGNGSIESAFGRL